MAVVAALRKRLSAFRRNAVARRQQWGLAALCASVLPLVACLALASAIQIVATAPAAAQRFTYNPHPPRPTPPKVPHDNQMLVQANEVDYDYNNSRVSAVGNVQLFYNGTSV